jgi:hypothetical protein
MYMRSIQAMDISMKLPLWYSKEDAKDSDPCDDWSGLPIPKTKENKK